MEETIKKEDTAVKPKHKRGKSFWLQFAAWTAAICLLLGVVIYYNAIDKYVPPNQVQSEQLPDFTLQMYGYEGSKYALLDETFSTADHKGEIMIINFWATWCGGCVDELPYFVQIAEEYPDINVIAIQGVEDRPVPAFIREKGWHTSKIIFLQDNVVNGQCETFKALGGTSMWPRTIIVNKEGEIVLATNTEFTYNSLKTEVDKVLQSSHH